MIHCRWNGLTFTAINIYKSLLYLFTLFFFTFLFQVQMKISCNMCRLTAIKANKFDFYFYFSFHHNSIHTNHHHISPLLNCDLPLRYRMFTSRFFVHFFLRFSPFYILHWCRKKKKKEKLSTSRVEWLGVMKEENVMRKKNVLASNLIKHFNTIWSSLTFFYVDVKYIKKKKKNLTHFEMNGFFFFPLDFIFKTLKGELFLPVLRT